MHTHSTWLSSLILNLNECYHQLLVCFWVIDVSGKEESAPDSDRFPSSFQYIYLLGKYLVARTLQLNAIQDLGQVIFWVKYVAY